MAQNYKAGLIITGDASGGIRAIKATDDELGKLNQGFDRGSRRSRQFNQDVNATSQGLGVLRRAAAPIAGVIAGMFAANTLQSQIDWGDQLQKTNLRIGASTEALSQYSYVAKLSGVEFGQLTTAWQRQTRRIAEAAAGTGVAVAALDRLNLSAQELNQLAPEDQFERIAAAMQGVENSSERVRLAQQLWDSEGVKLVQIVNQGTGAMAAMRAEADALGLTISQDTANAMASYNDEVDRLKFAAQGVSQTLLAELVPAMTAGLQETNAFIQQVGGAEVVVGHLIDGGKVLAALMAGRYAGAFATATAAKLAATQQSIAYQMALARMAGVSATAAGAQASLAAATRGAGAAMALVGGPLGAAMIAGGAIYYFREELGLVAPKVQSATDRVDDMTSALDANSEAALKNARAMLEAERQFQQFQQARLAMEVNRQQQVVADEQEQWESVGGQQAFGMGMRSEAQQKLHDLRLELLDTRQAIEAAGGSVTEIDEKLEELERTTRDIIPPTTELGSATETAAAKAQAHADAADAQAAALEELRNRLIPGRRETIQLAKETNTLALAMAMGRGNTVQLIQMMGQLQQKYIEGQRETDNLATASEDASQRIANSFTTWGTIADNTLRNVDDTGRDAWLGLIDGSTSALDTVERAFQQTFANIAHMLTTQKLTFEVAGMMGLDTTGMPGGGGGLNFGSMGSLYSSATKLPYVGDAISGVVNALGFGSSSAAAGGLYANALTGSAAAGGLYAGASTGAAVGGLYGNALTGAAATAGGGFMSAASAAMPWLAGGMLIDNVLGLGIVDGIVGGISDLFGGGKSDPRLNISTRADAGQYSHESVRMGAFGAVGFSEGTKRSNDLFGSVEAEREWLARVAANDNVTASAARTTEQFNAMTEATQHYVITSGDAQGAIDQLAGRTAAATRVIDAELTQTLVDAGASAEEIAQRFASATSAMDTLTSASARLNLQFDASAEGAYRAADSLSQRVGGPEALNALLSDYYDAFYTEEEKLDDLAEELRDTFATMGRELPTTREGVRDLVEGLEAMGMAGQAQLATILQTTPALREYVAAMEAQQTTAQTAAQLSYSSIVGIDGAMDDYNSAVSLAERLASERKQQLQEEQRAVDQLGQMLDSLMLSNQSILDPMERLNEAQRQYAQLEIRAQAGDTQAAGQLQGASTAYLDAAAAVYGQSSSQYAMIFNDVTASVRSLEGQYGDSLAALGSIESIERQLLREQQRARDTLTRTLSEQIQANAELSSLGGLLELLPDHLANALSGILGQAVTPNGNTYTPGGFDAEGDALLTGSRGGVADAFRDVLGRDPDDSGLAYYEGEYNSGRMSLDEIRRRLEDSDEANNRFATGAAFTNSIVQRPTMFDMGLMGEAGPEAIMPLTNIGGKLGVRAELPMPNLPPLPMPTPTNTQVNSHAALLRAFEGMRSDNAALVAQVQALEEQLAAIAGNTGALVDPARRTADATEGAERSARLQKRNPA